MKRHPRKIKLVMPAFQLKLASVFLVTALVATAVQAITLHRTVMKLAPLLPTDGGLLATIWPEQLVQSTLLTASLLLFMILGVGIAITHKIAGPLHRFEIYLRALKSDQASEPCKLRDTDQLQDFCQLLNEATEPLRAESSNERASRAAA